MVGNGEMFQTAFSHKVLKEGLTYDQRVEIAIEVLNEFGIYGKQREEWLDAIP